VAKKIRITSPEVCEPEAGLWSNCYRVGDQVIFAGMVAWDKDKNLVGGGDPFEQSVAAFNNMQALIKAAGGTMKDIVRITVYLTDMAFRPAFLEARRKFFTGDFPAAAVVGNITLAHPDLLVEITGLGFIGAGDP